MTNKNKAETFFHFIDVENILYFQNVISETLESVFDAKDKKDVAAALERARIYTGVLQDWCAKEIKRINQNEVKND